MESTGARIKKLRQELGISLEEVHKKTKIHLNILKAIEEDSLVNFSPVYIKGFLKIYCKFLRVNPKDFISGYKDPQDIVKYRPDTKEKYASFIKTIPAKLSSFRLSRKIKLFFIAILIIIFIAMVLFNLGKAISSKRSSQKIKKTQSTELKKANTVINTPKPKTLEVLTPNKDTTFGIRLGIRAKEDCWIRLKADGKVIFQNILKKGRQESWQVKERIELSLGNAGVVDLEVNGKIIPPLGRRGQALKNILITKNGLSVLR